VIMTAGELLAAGSGEYRIITACGGAEEDPE
jgi:hypothetical protein